MWLPSIALYELRAVQGKWQEDLPDHAQCHYLFHRFCYRTSCSSALGFLYARQLLTFHSVALASTLPGQTSMSIGKVAAVAALPAPIVLRKSRRLSALIRRYLGRVWYEIPQKGSFVLSLISLVS